MFTCLYLFFGDKPLINVFFFFHFRNRYISFFSCNEKSMILLVFLHVSCSLKEVVRFYDFTKKEKEKKTPSTTIVAAQTRDNNSGENSESIWKSRYSPIPCHCVALDLSKGLHLLSIVPLLFEARKRRHLRLVLFLFFFQSKTRVAQREESYVPRRAYRFFPTCLEMSVFVPIHLSIHFTWSVKQTVIGFKSSFLFFFRLL